MNFLAPWWLAAAAALAAAVLALHLLARRRPKPLYFPTTRFIPDRPASAASPAARPTDLLLLLLRLLLVILLGTALARPVISSPRRTTQIVLLDQSRLAPPVDSASAARLRSADVVIAFDSSSRVVEPNTNTGLPEPTSARGSLSVALVAAIRSAITLGDRGDSLALTIISPFAVEEFDAATLRIRQQWKGGIALVSVPARQPAMPASPVVLPPDDPLGATLALLASDSEPSGRLVRGRPNPADSAWAREGGALIVWPRVLREMGWPRGPNDSVGGVAAGKHAVVALFPREFSPPPGEIAAVWADGGVAATSVAVGKGCIRNVAIPVPEAGDLVLRGSFLRLSRTLLSPCSGWIQSTQAADPLLDSLRGAPVLRSSGSVAKAAEQQVPAHRWLLLSAALLFAIEPLVRRRRRP